MRSVIGKSVLEPGLTTVSSPSLFHQCRCDSSFFTSFFKSVSPPAVSQHSWSKHSVLIVLTVPWLSHNQWFRVQTGRILRFLSPPPHIFLFALWPQGGKHTHTLHLLLSWHGRAHTHTSHFRQIHLTDRTTVSGLNSQVFRLKGKKNKNTQQVVKTFWN